MEVAILEMPIDRNYKVRLDGDHLPGYIAEVDGIGWQVTLEVDGVEKSFDKTCASRESAAFMMLFYHLENEHKSLRKKRSGDS